MKKLIWKQSLQFSSNENWTVVQAWIFSDLIFILIQVVFITARIASIFISSTAVHIYEFHIFTVIYSPLHRFIWNQHYDQLPVGLLAQLVECCTSIAEVMGSNFVQAWIFFWLYFHYFLSSVHNCEDRSNICLFMRICGKIKITASTW